ncbi:aminopeptidase [Conexibacter sp. S30A1]|jgi:aminopeptidase|uniref:aminopeptidase n=1 Tax=Conexibacter sp. S30A1 TaxID=2937800 RepID=UPI00201069B4|nr:aminopeptidase [Conexibacter sp. S30A1]
MSYEPDPQVLERYGRVLVDFALGNGAGIKPGDTVLVMGAEETKPLFAEVCRAVWRSGGNVIEHLTLTQDERINLERDFYELAEDAQLDFFAAKLMRGMLDQSDHLLYIAGEQDPRAMADVDPQKMMRHQAAQMPMMGWRQEKEAAGLLHWTIGLWGTAGMAAEAELSLEQYWEQIIRACFLDDSDPIVRWRETQAEITRYREWLNSLAIERLHVEAEGTDLWLTIGSKRRWLGGGGRNIPSFEIFTCPDWRGTQGHISFSEPLYSHGKVARGIRLEFKDGLVSSATAEENPELIEQIVAAPGGNRVGEFSLTDARLSRIDRFMANTLYDENMGGPYGNTHLAVGMSFNIAYDGEASEVGQEEWEALGFNLAAAVHNDIVSTTDRTVTAVMRDGSQRVIYADGRFQLE